MIPVQVDKIQVPAGPHAIWLAHTLLLPTTHPNTLALPISSLKKALSLDLPKAQLKCHVLRPTAKVGPQVLSLSINDLSWLTLQH